MTARAAKPLVLLSFLVLLLPSSATGDETSLGQVFQQEPHSFLAVFNPVRDEYLVYKSISNSVDPTVRVYNSAGEHRMSVFPLRALAGAQQVSLWSVAATHDGGLIMSLVVEASKRQVSRQLIRYDSEGLMKWARDMGAFHTHLVSEDARGYVYVLGHGRNYPSKLTADSGLLVRYSPDGKTSEDLLRVSDLESSAAATLFDDASAMLFSRMKHRAGTLTLYLGPLREILQFDLRDAGAARRLKARISLAGALDAAMRATSETRDAPNKAVMGVDVRDDGRAVAQLGGCGGDSSCSSLVCIDGTGTNWENCGAPLSASSGLFLGVASDDRFVFVTSPENGPLFRRE